MTRRAAAGCTRGLRWDFPSAAIRTSSTAALTAHLAAAGINAAADRRARADIRAHAVQRNLKPLGQIKNVVAVASGKGGVGKSTVAVNLALAWAAQGARVGILDADIYGPSQPLMLGLDGPAPLVAGWQAPAAAHEPRRSSAMSIGFLVDAEQPMVWRGPMVTQALTQLLSETQWGELDYLVVDMPPGTGRHPAHAGAARAGRRCASS